MTETGKTVQAAHLSAKDFEERFARTDDATLLDVRTPFEFQEGHIRGALNLDVYNASFVDEVRKLDTSRPLFVYCRSGNRSYTVAQALPQLGFTEVYNLADGIISWEGELE